MLWDVGGLSVMGWGGAECYGMGVGLSVMCFGPSLFQAMKTPTVGPQLFTTATSPENQTKNLFSYALPCMLKRKVYEYH